MLSYSAGSFVDGELRSQSARDAWNSAAAPAAVAMARAPHQSGGAAIEDGTPIARLVIPSIDLDEIVLEGSGALDAGPGHVSGSAFPGERGNSVISGERDRHFSHLDAVSAGDTLYTESGLVRDTWLVISKRIVKRDDALLTRASDTTLTLATSWPIRFVGPAPERLIVTAARLSRPAARVAPAH